MHRIHKHRIHMGLCALAGTFLVGCSSGGSPTAMPGAAPEAALRASGAALSYDADGRPVAMVTINGRGPFPLAVDTAAQATMLSPALLSELDVEPDPHRKAMLHGVGGATVVDLYPVSSVEFGGLRGADLLIVAPPEDHDDNQGGDHAGHRGVVGADVFGDARLVFNLAERRIFNDVENETVGRLRSLSADAVAGSLMVIDIDVNGVATRAVIDTGAKRSLGNAALMNAAGLDAQAVTASHSGVTGHSVDFVGEHTVTITLDGVSMEPLAVEFADAHIFGQLGLTDAPALILGMDALSQFDVFAVDYRNATFEFAQ